MDNKSIFRVFIGNHKVQYALGIALLAGSLPFQLYTPIVLERVTDGLQRLSIGLGDVFRYGAILAGAGLFMAAFVCLSRICLFELARRLEREIRARLFTHWERLSAEYYNNQRIGDLMAHAVNDVNVVRDMAMSGVFMLVEAVLLISVAVVMMGSMVHLGLTLSVALPLPLLAFMAYMYNARIQRESTDVQEAYSNLASRAQQFCAGVRVIQANAQERQEQDKFTEVNDRNRFANARLIRSNSSFTAISAGLVGLSYLISVVFGGILVLRGAITLGEFVAFNVYLSFLIGPVENLGKVINTFQRAVAADVRLRRILRTEPQVKDADVAPVERLRGEIVVSGLTFAYPDGDNKPALHDIDLVVPAGSSLALIGKVGSGKTTLINLLLRVYNPPAGTVFFDGLDTFRIPLRTLRDSIGYVPQDYFLFSSTIGDNIAFDPQPYSAEQIHQASRLAQVYDNIVAFPNRFNTRLGERGVSLSGGQRQRISIARALIKDPPILVFDDSLSAVDAETEEIILHNLRTVAQGRTTLIVSHRVSTVRHADQIVVMDEGRIAERGSHDELVRAGGIYAKMVAKQSMNQDMERIEKDLQL